MTVTLETMRADIAGVLDLEPAEIGDADNLVDLGLDSMRLMNLILTWQEAGVPLEFSEYAQHVTLGEWWTMIEARLNAGGGQS